jgi:hypothetical protein
MTKILSVELKQLRFSTCNIFDEINKKAKLSFNPKCAQI